MKPINLKIKGLNSFIEMQEINFERLTERGLFGIFGPTGSGKSTILDGIILSLYGSVPRESSNFMNTNCDTMNVSFEFQITEKDAKRYRVEREFKRDKSGSIKTKSAKIVDITTAETVLEDRVRQVTDKCKEIIGLEVNDFTRTVVLPQGSFSEFLKLQGKERRDMLERLFNLQKYGDNLSNKLSLNIGKEVQKLSALDGELKSYEDVSTEILENTDKYFKEVKIQIEKLLVELALAEKEYNEGKEVWDLQKELLIIEEKEKALKEIESEIKELDGKVTKGESSHKAKPYIDAYESTLNQINEVTKKLSELKIKAASIESHKKNIEKSYSAAKNNKDTMLPALKVKEQQIFDAIEEQKTLNGLIIEMIELEESKNKADSNIVVVNNDIKKSENNILSLNDNISYKENNAEQLKVPEEFKDKVNFGFLLQNSYDNLMGQINKINNEIKEINTSINEALTLSEICSVELNEKEDVLQINENTLKTLTENCPGDQNSLLKYKENLDNTKSKWEKHNDFNTLIIQSKNNVEALKIELKTKQNEAFILNEEINSSKEALQKQEKENLAYIFRKELSDGEICPVCGSTEHHHENIISIKSDFNIETYKKNLNSKEIRYTEISAEIVKIQTNMQAEQESIKKNEVRLHELGDDYKNISVDDLNNEFQRQIIEVNKFIDDKSKLEKYIRVLSEEKSKLLLKYNKVISSLDYNKNQLKKLTDDLNLKNEEVKKKEKELYIVKEELKIDDLEKTKEEISQKEKKRNILEKEIKNHRENLKTELELKDKLIKKLNEFKILLKELNTTINEKNKSINEKKEIIKNKSGNIENLEVAKEQISDSIKKIVEEYEKHEKNKENIEIQFNSCNNEIMSEQGNYISLKERSESDSLSLLKVLEEEGIRDIEEAKSTFISKKEIEYFKKKIDDYLNSLAQIRGASINLKNKLKDRVLTEEQWHSIQNIKNEKVELLDKVKEEKINLEAELKKITEKLSYKKELQKNKDELSHKLGLLKDLEKLFRGKKFIEFVAANQLKYVSIEAGKRLKEITGGTYGLEVDQDSKFLIRDYKNGGAERDATTLSGGETFVASLALALALSSQIQLKGTAPLELFFLDEGFGTLDDNLLEVVMDSLEKIHHDKLSVGIISHVESIKNRVPLKLIVTPAVSGMGGSKVKIEIN